MSDGSQQPVMVPVGRYSVRPLRKLAEGGFAQIFLVKDAYGPREMVLKRSFIGDEESRRIVTTEVSVMKRLEHPNIVTLFDATETTQRGRTALLLLMEYCPGGTLLAQLNAQKSLMREDAVWSIFRDVAMAVHFMHRCDPPIAHRDIKLENILRCGSGGYKLCDFGSCVVGRVSCATEAERAAEEDRIERTTTLMYRAPEMVDFFGVKAIDHGVDVWALGCILYAIAFRSHPFQDKGKLAILGLDYAIPSSSPFSDALHTTIRRMLAPQSERACSGEVMTRVDAAIAHTEPDLRAFPRATAAAASAGDGDKRGSRSSQGRRRTRKATTGLSKTDLLLQQTLGTTTPRHQAGGSSSGGGGGGGGGWGQPQASASRAPAPAPAPAHAPAPAFEPDFGAAGGFPSAQPPSASTPGALPSFLSQPQPRSSPGQGADAARGPALTRRAHSYGDHGRRQTHALAQGQGQLGYGQQQTGPGDSSSTFDPFAATAPKPSRTASAPSVNAPQWAPPAAAAHGQGLAPYQAAANTADPFGFAGVQSSAAGPAVAAGAAGTNPFGAAEDLFGHAQSAPMQSAPAAAAGSNPFGAAEDLFGNAQSAPTHSAPAPAPAAGSNPFGAAEDLFGHAQSAPTHSAPAPAPAPAGGGDAFDPFAPAGGGAGAAATTSAVFDPFASQGADPFSP